MRAFLKVWMGGFLLFSGWMISAFARTASLSFLASSALFFLACELACLAGVLYRSELDLDLGRRTYRRKQGFHPWAKEQTGTLDGGVHLEVRPYESWGDSPSWGLYLVWGSGSVRPHLLWVHGREATAQADLKELAEWLGLPMRT